MNTRIMYLFLLFIIFELSASDNSTFPRSGIHFTAGEWHLYQPVDSQGLFRDSMNTQVSIGLPGIVHINEKKERTLYRLGFDVPVATGVYWLSQLRILPAFKSLLITGFIAPLPIDIQVKKFLARSTDVMLEASLQGICYGHRAGTSSAIGLTGILACRTTMPIALMQCGVPKEIACDSQMANDYMHLVGKYGVVPRLQPSIEQKIFCENRKPIELSLCSFEPKKPTITAHAPEKIAKILGIAKGGFISNGITSLEP